MFNLFELEKDYMTVHEFITTMPKAAIISPDSLEFTAQESYSHIHYPYQYDAIFSLSNCVFVFHFLREERKQG